MIDHPNYGKKTTHPVQWRHHITYFEGIHTFKLLKYHITKMIICDESPDGIGRCYSTLFCFRWRSMSLPLMKWKIQNDQITEIQDNKTQGDKASETKH